MSQAPVAPDPAFGTRPSTPYGAEGARTTGHAAGPGPSAERAHQEANDGTAAERQQRILALLGEAGPMGYTADELQRRGVAPHRSAVSAHTSSLHKEGQIECLADRRDRAGVYVLPEHVNGRRTRAFAGRPHTTSWKDAADKFAEAQAENERLADEIRRLKSGIGTSAQGIQNDMAVTGLEIERLTAEVNRLAAERDAAEARGERLAGALKEANRMLAARPRLTDEERTLVANFEDGLKRRRDQGILSLRRPAVIRLVEALRRLDS